MSARTSRAPTPQTTDLGFYGWRIVSVAFIVDFVAVGFFFYSFGVFLKPIAADLDGSRFSVSLALSISNGVGALASPFIGRSLDQRSIRRIMIIGAVAVGAGFLALSNMESIWQLYLTMGTLFAFGMSMMGGLASAKLVSNWFEQTRGRALGIATIGVSFSGLVMPLVATWLIAAVGWRSGFQVYSALTIAIVVPLVAWTVVDRPEDMGLLPDGGAPMPEPSERGRGVDRTWRTAELLRNRNFWAIAFPFALAFSSLSAVLVHLVPFASDAGLSAQRAALIASVAAGAGAIGKPIFGGLVDRVDARVAIAASFSGQLVGLVLFILSGTFLSMLAAGILFGFSMGGVVPLHGAVTARAFGRLSFGKALGLLRPVQIPIHVLGPPLAGWVFDTTGSYAPAFWTFTGFYVAAIASIAWLRLEPAR
ncbi:MAG: MFS transporter [Myxococcota bacterium]